MAVPDEMPGDLPAPQLSENAQVVLERRYLDRAPDGRSLETPAQMLWRVAVHVAGAETRHGGDAGATARAFYEMMAALRFLPASPTLMNAGRPIGQLSACFVLPIEDSLESIFTTLKHAARVHQSGGGTGFDFSAIRPVGDPVQSTHGVASGPLSFLRIYNATTDEIRQGGARRGANMGILRIDHPDIRDFIQAKADPSALRNFNLSVAVTDAFMRALAAGEDHELIHPLDRHVVDRIPARRLFAQITEAACATGEPGLFFVDRANARNPMRAHETIAATNPCGEQGLAAYDSCNLGSIDLARHVHTIDGATALDEQALRATATLATRFLDNVLEVQRFPLDQIERKTLANRRIGLGIMGLARLLYRLGVLYGSVEGRRVAYRAMSIVHEAAHAESRKMATERGPFPAWKGSTWHERGIPMRNAAVTTVAPTGTIGMIADTSGGCEPEFSLVYVKRCLDGARLPYLVDEVEEIARREGFWHPDLMDQIAANGGTVRGLAKVPAHWQDVLVTAHEVAPEDHVRMQAELQGVVDNAVSKTVNLPRDANAADVDSVFRLAYELGCVGITVYREGSRPDQVLALPDSPNPPTGSLPEDQACRACPPVPERERARLAPT